LARDNQETLGVNNANPTQNPLDTLCLGDNPIDWFTLHNVNRVIWPTCTHKLILEPFLNAPCTIISYIPTAMSDTYLGSVADTVGKA
jgi:hypothetical protein